MADHEAWAGRVEQDRRPHSEFLRCPALLRRSVAFPETRMPLGRLNSGWNTSGVRSTNCPTVASRHCCEMVSQPVSVCDVIQTNRTNGMSHNRAMKTATNSRLRGERAGLETGSSTFSEDMSEVPCHDPTGRGAVGARERTFRGPLAPGYLARSCAVADSTKHRRTEFQIRPRFRDGFGNPSYVRYAISRCRKSAAHLSLWIAPLLQTCRGRGSLPCRLRAFGCQP